MAAPTYTLSELQTEANSGLNYRLRLPSPAAPTKLLVLLHGVGSNETNLLDLGARVLPREAFLERLDRALAEPTRKGPWTEPAMK